jgi:hypothetical protein
MAPAVHTSLVTREWLEACDRSTLMQVLMELERARVAAQVEAVENRSREIAAKQEIPGASPSRELRRASLLRLAACERLVLLPHCFWLQASCRSLRRCESSQRARVCRVPICRSENEVRTSIVPYAVHSRLLCVRWSQYEPRGMSSHCSSHSVQLTIGSPVFNLGNSNPMTEPLSVGLSARSNLTSIDQRTDRERLGSAR